MNAIARRLRGLAAGVLLAAAAASAQQPSAEVKREGDAIRFTGRIDSASAREFLRLAAAPGARRLVIRSPGGLVAPALDIAEAVHERGLDVEVDESCLSSCANYVFPAGRHKRLTGPGAVGWHGNMAHVLYRQEHGEEHWSEGMMVQARALARREAAFYRSIGVDGLVCWFAKLPPYDVDEFYTLAPADMARFGIGDVEVQDAAAPLPPDVQRVSVDWQVLEATRPTIKLAE